MSGLHHVTAITRDVQANVDFWMGFLGLSLVKQTAGFEDAEQLHLFYGDAAGAPGTLVSFLVWQGGAAGRVGHGQAAEIALAIPRGRIGDWLTRAMQHGLSVQGPMREFGDPVLRLRDPDGIIVKLVGLDIADAGWPAPPAHLAGATLWSEDAAATAAFLARFGYRPAGTEGGVTRLRSDRDELDIRDAAGFVPGIPGTGVIDHVALRVPDRAALEAHASALTDTTAHDRLYFASLYMRDPAGLLIEAATDGPGMGIDEAQLGRTLMVPPHFDDSTDLRLRLPQFARPGEERRPMRDLPFTHRIHTPEDPDGSTLILLHGTGGSETDLMPLAHRIAPRATLLGLRGRSTEEGVARFFRRLSMTTFDQDDIRAEAEAFAGFWRDAVAAYDLDADRIAVLGYSNGANFAGAVMALHPGLIRRAVLMRPMLALDPVPEADLTGLAVLTLAGQGDPYGVHAPALNDWLARSGADLDARMVPGGHQLAQDDLRIAADWLGA
ncbi:ring-cleaving dioxygenase [Paracoccus aestuarii]|uniref:Ring-cleaving dioxygenase n=1 Tax=Paracoccus aestuarii TaxID=453842 RepID=A0A419A219_9RHOB|nr:VOC family protein [Paracoccus aestuarii]RJL07119.1 ring-cleaving dioxygenase [Paracoccus aestuarii]WCQ99528.1 VOC family protein [Paracoccus aestuarii]